MSMRYVFVPTFELLQFELSPLVQREGLKKRVLPGFAFLSCEQKAGLFDEDGKPLPINRLRTTWIVPMQTHKKREELHAYCLGCALRQLNQGSRYPNETAEDMFKVWKQESHNYPMHLSVFMCKPRMLIPCMEWHGVDIPNGAGAVHERCDVCMQHYENTGRWTESGIIYNETDQLFPLLSPVVVPFSMANDPKLVQGKDGLFKIEYTDRSIVPERYSLAAFHPNRDLAIAAYFGPSRFTNSLWSGCPVVFPQASFQHTLDAFSAVAVYQQSKALRNHAHAVLKDFARLLAEGIQSQFGVFEMLQHLLFYPEWSLEERQVVRFFAWHWPTSQASTADLNEYTALAVKIAANPLPQLPTFEERIERCVEEILSSSIPVTDADVQLREERRFFEHVSATICRERFVTTPHAIMDAALEAYSKPSLPFLFERQNPAIRSREIFLGLPAQQRLHAPQVRIPNVAMDTSMNIDPTCLVHVAKSKSDATIALKGTRLKMRFELKHKLFYRSLDTSSVPYQRFNEFVPNHMRKGTLTVICERQSLNPHGSLLAPKTSSVTEPVFLDASFDMNDARNELVLEFPQTINPKPTVNSLLDDFTMQYAPEMRALRKKAAEENVVAIKAPEVEETTLAVVKQWWSNHAMQPMFLLYYLIQLATLINAHETFAHANDAWIDEQVRGLIEEKPWPFDDPEPSTSPRWPNLWLRIRQKSRELHSQGYTTATEEHMVALACYGLYPDDDDSLTALEIPARFIDEQWNVFNVPRPNVYHQCGVIGETGRVVSIPRMRTLHHLASTVLRPYLRERMTRLYTHRFMQLILALSITRRVQQFGYFETAKPNFDDLTTARDDDREGSDTEFYLYALGALQDLEEWTNAHEGDIKDSLRDVLAKLDHPLYFP